MIATRRGQETLLNPGPEAVLTAKDEVLLFGGAEQLEAGENALQRKLAERIMADRVAFITTNG